MSGAKTFMDFRSSIINSINTAMPARVISYDEATCTAKIKPLIRVETNQRTYTEREVIENVPVLKQKYRVNGGSVQTYVPVLQSDDIVQVVINQSDISQARKGHMVNPNGRKFSVNNAVIVGVF